MKTTYPLSAPLLVALFLGTGWGWADEKPVAPAEINGVAGVKQEAVPSVRKVEPPTANAAVVNQAQGTTNVNGVNTVNGVKAEGHEAVQPVAPVPPPLPPPPPPAGSATQVGGGSVGAVSSIHAVQGVQGINVPRQQNLEAALLVKGAPGAPTAKGKAAAAALFKGPPGGPPKNLPGKDGRAGFQEFEKLNTPGS
ncbi:MAG TPA: hypothetical protein VK961_16820 [Chthoniobacter sp.]|nr:hypothetical protein [Chthoniobacter sp.]